MLCDIVSYNQVYMQGSFELFDVISKISFCSVIKLFMKNS